MNQKLKCSFVKDLLPLYIDDMVSEETKNEIINHLKECKECSQICNDMKKEICDLKLEDINVQKDFLKQAKNKYIVNALNILGILAISICLIVNLAVNKGFTWFPIACVSILYAGAIVDTLIKSRQQKVLRCMGVITIGLVILLATIQVSRYYLMNCGSLWLVKFGLPIACIWIAILWIPVLLNKFCKCNIFDSIAILLILVLLGNYVTKIVTGDINSRDELLSQTLFLQNGLGFVIGAVVLFLIGRIKVEKE